MNKRYGAKFREIYNKNTQKTREVYSAVIYDDKTLNGEILVSDGDKILEFTTEDEAFKVAKEVYEKFKGINWD